MRMPKLREGNSTVINAAEVRQKVEKSGFLKVRSDKKVVSRDTGYSSIVGRRTRPLVIKCK